MANISQIKLPNGDVYNFQDSVSGYLVPSDIEGKVDNFHIQIGEQISGDYYSIDKTYADILMTAFVGKDYMTCSDVDLGYPYVGIASINNNTVIAFGISVTFNNTAYLDGYVILPNDTAMRIHEATIIPTKTSQLTNDSGFITSYTDTKVKQVPLSGTNSGKNVVISYGLNSNETNSVYTSTYMTYNDYGPYLTLTNKSDSTHQTTVSHEGLHITTGSYTASIDAITQTTNHTIKLPDKSGTIALTNDIPTSLPASDVYSWAKASSKPTYTASEVGALASNTTYVSKITTTAGAHTAISNKSGAVSFNVPTTAAHVGIKFGYTTSGNNRAVLQDSSGNLYVTQKDDNTTYSSKAAASGGTEVSLVTTGEKYTWNSKTSNTGTITSVKTTAGAHSTINITSGAANFNVPTKTSHLTNDSGFITSSVLNNYLPLTGGKVTGPTTFGDTVSIDDLNAGQLVVSGNASFANTINGNITTASALKDSNNGNSITACYSTGGVTDPSYYCAWDGYKITYISKANLKSAINTNTTYSAGTGLSLSSTTFSVKLGYTTSGNNRAVQADSSGNLYVVQKDDNTTYSSKAAASGGTDVSLVTTGEKYTWNSKTSNTGTITSVKTTAGAHTAINTTSGAVSFNVPTTAAHVGIKFGYTTSGNNRAVQQDSSGNLYVTQKDTDTTVSTLTLAEDTGTSAITLAHSGKYKLTAGTKTLIFTMPSSGNTDHRKSFYGTCSTAAGTAAKVISLSTTTGWELVAGTTITVKFSATNTAQNPTFNVNSSGAKSVWYNTAVITTDSLNRAGYATRPQMYVYDGSHWVWMGMSAEDNTTYSVMSASELSTGTATSARTMSAANTKAGLLDLFYPVGSYYETSDTSFDPNKKWGGTWVLEVAGQVHVSAGTGYTVSGALNNTSDGGSKDAIIPYHNHGFTQPTISSNTSGYYILGTTGTLTRSNVKQGTGTQVSNVLTAAAAVTRDGAKATGGAVHYAGTDGNTTDANMQPYVVVNRWHRTA